MDHIDEEYDRLTEHLHDCAKKAESFKTTKRCLSLETLELIRQRGAARAAGNQEEFTSELARLCREAIKKDLKERRAEVLAEAAEAGKASAMPVEIRQSQDEDDCSPEPEGNNQCIEKGKKRTSSMTSTLISSTAMSTCLLTI
ncbi:hypothetical protein RB195_008201 [Necator americanus]